MMHYLLSNQRILPIEYLEVEYLECTGELYIDTEYIPTFNTTTYIKFLETVDAIQNTRYFGAGANNYYLMYCGDSGTNFKCYGLMKQSVYTSINNENLDINEIIFNDINHEVLFNNIQKVTLTNPDNNTTNFSMYVFWANGTDSSYPKASMRLYSFIIWESMVLKKHFIPCYRKSDNKPGMFDLVEQQFYTNQGTGEFLVGNPIKGYTEFENLGSKANGIVKKAGYATMGDVTNILDCSLIGCYALNSESIIDLSKISLPSVYSLSLWFKSQGGASTSSSTPIISVGDTTLKAFHWLNGTESIGCSTTTPTKGVWHHLVLIWNGSSLKLYIDSELKSTGNTINSLSVSNTYTNDTLDYVNNFRIYDRVITDEEILKLYVNKDI